MHRRARALGGRGWLKKPSRWRRRIPRAFRFPSIPVRSIASLAPDPDALAHPSLRRACESRLRQTRARFGETSVRLPRASSADARMILLLRLRFDSCVPRPEERFSRPILKRHHNQRGREKAKCGWLDPAIASGDPPRHLAISEVMPYFVGAVRLHQPTWRRTQPEPLTRKSLRRWG